MFLLSQDARVVFVMLFLTIGISRRGRGSHWRINRNRHNRNRMLVFQLSNQVNDLLRAADRKCRNEYRSLALGGIVDDSRKRDFRIFRIVQAITVGRFDEQVVTWRRRTWIANDGLIVMAQVTRKQHAPAVHFQQHKTRPQNVAGNSKARLNSWRDLDRVSRVSNWTKQFQRSKRIL